MPTNFPTGLDDTSNLPTAADLANDNLDTKPHSTLHGDLGLAVIALETKVGIDDSADTTSLDYEAANALPAATPFTVVVGDDYEAGTTGTARYMVVTDESSTVFGLVIEGEAFPHWVFTADGSFILGTGDYNLLNPVIPTDAMGIIGFQPQSNGLEFFGSGASILLSSGIATVTGVTRAGVVTATDFYRHNADAMPQVELRYNYSGAVGAPPSSGEFSFDNADPMLATAIYIKTTNPSAIDLTDLLRSFPVATIQALSSGEDNFVSFSVTGRTEHSGYQEFAVTAIDSDGSSLADVFADKLRFTGRRGVEARNSEPADATLLNGAYTTWLDATPGSTALHIKAKDSAGTVRTATIPLS